MVTVFWQCSKNTSPGPYFCLNEFETVEEEQVLICGTVTATCPVCGDTLTKDDMTDTIPNEVQELEIDKFLVELIDEGSSERAIIEGFAMMERTVLIVKVQKAIVEIKSDPDDVSLPWLVYNRDMSVYMMSSHMVPDVEERMGLKDEMKRYFWGYVDGEGTLFVLAAPPCNQERSW